MSNDSFNDEFDDGRAAKPGMSTGVKVLIGVLVGGGLLSLLCCGGVIWFSMNAVKIVETPAEVEEMTKEIVDIKIPDTFTGKAGFKFEIFGVGMKMVAYEGATPETTLLIMESKQPGEASAEDQMEQFQNQLEQQGQGGEFQQEELADSESETRTLTVRGAPVEFTFSKGKGKNSGTELQQVSGVIEGANGAVIIMINMPEEDYNEEEIVKMIESIQ